ncbi:VacJ family lipoprotein [Halieaceae bacterium IMCC14734]|uniref:VacJ family lipoprotein n=1 Tax=Candidatus Litorirhabdus singularis TaxID=2518993 RepID=A0ABT3TF38_9GAMM|nr:VacJ family lipoprotein [Candidatus Litorirhabdus singularis]MCX2980805.1 VacJ family lipoprotein [Candidatus Litorirhabdus singularis]
MNCTATTISAVNHRAVEAGLSPAKPASAAVVYALALVTGALFMALPLPSHADQDPLMEVNRTVHDFNRGMDAAILKPIAETYTTITPLFMQRRASRFFSNIDDIKVTINDLLQLKFKQAAGDAGRLVINTTIGVAGLFEVAGPAFGLEKHHEDFGQTLGFWAIGPGPYIELPFVGPSTVRDSAGALVDTIFNPLQLLQGSQSISLAAGDSINDRAALLDVEELISGDHYVFIREVYLQHRHFLINDGQIVDTFGDFDSGFEEEYVDGY